MARRKFAKKFSKYADEAIIVVSTVKKIELQNVEVNEKLKTVFYCESNQLPEGRLCIAWGRTNIDVGSRFQAKGRLLPDGTFLVWSMLRFKDEWNFSKIGRFINGRFNLSIWIPCRLDKQQKGRETAMQTEEFETIRDFNRKFPSKIFICSRCQGMTQNPHQCTRCNNQSTNFLFTENTYSYTIKEYGITETIFKPIELEKGE